MNCTNCNALLEPGAKFCGECGHPVTVSSSAPPKVPTCTSCGSELEPGTQFCGECGHPVTAEALPSGPLSPAAPTLLEVGPPPSPARPPIEITPSPAKKPAPVPPPPQQRPAAPPPAAGAQQPAFQQQPLEPPKKGRSGCTIIIILLAVVAICCIGSLVVGWYIISAEYDFSSSGFDIPLLEQLQEEGFPFLDQFLGEETPDEIFNDFFSNQTSLILQNSSDLPVCYLYITPTVSEDWGDDWLGEDEVIFPGDTKTFQFEPNQFVDISARDCEEFLIYEQYEIHLSGEEVLITLDSAP